MPGWSPSVAYEFLSLARRDRLELGQAKIQKLVYIAHGLQLAITGEPLTGDRPEAWPFGPIYRRVAQALQSAGSKALSSYHLRVLHVSSDSSDLDASERDLIAQVHEDYGLLTNAELSQLTRRGSSPWAAVFAEGKGHAKEIAHREVRAQFTTLLAQARGSYPRS